MVRDVLGLDEVDQSDCLAVGGKATSLGELSRIGGVQVPAGICVTTAAFEKAMSDTTWPARLVGQLARVDPDDRERIRALGVRVRAAIQAIAVPNDVAVAVIEAVTSLGEAQGYAVRSSATGEDSVGASFAGQHDTFLSVIGGVPILERIARCWASLFTDRAITYRLRNGIDHRGVRMAVVVQQMVPAVASGALFTADPVTGNRTVSSIEAVPGLGEALVSGHANPERYIVRDESVVTTTAASKRPLLTGSQISVLAKLGRRVADHFGSPQDIEWCLAEDGFFIVQSRPITTLFPIPAADDDANHVYVSVGHQQMMTDPITPLGISVWQLTASRPMYTAGGRLFVDVTPELSSPAKRAAIIAALGSSDPLIGDALQSVVDRGDFIVENASNTGPPAPGRGGATPPIDTDPAIVTRLIARSEASLASLQRDIAAHSGEALVEFILADINELRRILSDPHSLPAIVAAIDATRWINTHMEQWLGETNAVDALTQSAPNNVTSEMGLALLDVADVIRPHVEVVAYLEQGVDDGFLTTLPALPGGSEARDAIQGYLEKYGMRCAGEIDIARPRWAEHPSTLAPMIVSNMRNFDAGEAKRRIARGTRTAREMEADLLTRLRALPDGERKALQTKAMIDRLRTFVGYREYPKYHMVARYFVYKRALLAEAERLARDGILRDAEDIFFLSFTELRDLVRTGQVREDLVRDRRQAFASQHALTPPRVLTSDGEAINGTYRRTGIPSGALVGLAVSAGTVEGRARVIMDIANADLEVGDILVTPFTDPSWTPLFVAIAGLVTEVGGLMTHGAVIAREYGLPTVVGVENATRLIRDRQRVRVHGTQGYIELLS